MKNLIKIFSILIIFNSCKKEQKIEKVQIEEIFNCNKGEMTPAFYEHGLDEKIPKIKNLKDGFIILVDTTLKTTNFISFEEDYERRKSVELDTSNLDWIDGWEKMTIKQKFEKVKIEKKSCVNKYKTIHRLNNQKRQQIWILNNSNDTVTIQMQDWSYICVLQAKTKKGNWKPIQYWRFSTCGNSYYNKKIPPKTANSFITELPNKGNFKTKLRYKILGQDKFYYSNEFDGKINYCEFVEDKKDYEDRHRETRPHYKLDSILNFEMPKLIVPK